MQHIELIYCNIGRAASLGRTGGCEAPPPSIVSIVTTTTNNDKHDNSTITVDYILYTIMVCFYHY